VVDDDGVSISEDKATKTGELVVVCGEDTKVTPVRCDDEGGSGREERWLEGTVDGVGGLKD
jgi:hypothetical protein